MSTEVAPNPERAEKAPEGPPVPSAARARGLTLWAIVAVAMSPFSIPTGGVSVVVALGLIAVALVMRFRGFNATRPLVAGVVAVCGNMISAGACSYLFLRPAEVSGHEATRQDRVEDRFDRAFDRATEVTPQGDGSKDDTGASKGGAEVKGDADSPTTRQEP